MRFIHLLAGLLSFASTPLLFAASPAQAADVDYQRDIKSVLQERCFACHGALKQEAGLRLDTVAAARQGGDSGAALIAANPAESLLLQRISAAEESERMPPEGMPLSPEQIAKFQAWIAAGANAPADEQPEADPNKHWAFQTPVKPALPEVADAAWAANPIDRLLAAQYARAGVTPAAPATPEVLLRRVYLDLIGLPPSRAELKAFLADPSEAAYTQVVEKLLASPQHGERWGRHWMDVWRYSDWFGRRDEKDVRNSFPHIWRWRDWIVKSLNADHGYDQMLQEMLAADELHPTDDETIVATGFIVRNWYSLNYDQWMRDQVEHTSKAFLGLRLNCALCHDHKYDPLTQEEYFRFRAFFEPLEIRQDRVPGGPDLPKYLKYTPGSGSSLKPIEAGLARIYDHDLKAETFMYRGGDSRIRFEGKPPVAPGTPAILGGEIKIEPVKLPPVAAYPGLKPWLRQQELAQAEEAVAKAVDTVAQVSAGPNPHAIAAATAQQQAAEARRTALTARMTADDARYENQTGDLEALSLAASLAERVAKLAAARASVAEKEQAVVAARDAAAADPADAKLKDAVAKVEKELTAAQQAATAAEAITNQESSDYSSLAPHYPTESTGRRTALAKWITRNDHPLTPRVAINHIWMRHFGQPLVETVFDFGRSGKLPTHPELLDWLAVELVEHGWQMKHIHRLIVTSRAYRLQSPVGQDAASLKNLAQDRDNRNLWHFPVRRLEAEAIRDSILQTAGQLDVTMGGPELVKAEQDKSRRRSLYFELHPETGGTLDFTALFDAPNPEDCYRRAESIQPQQALATTNSQLVVQQGRLLAKQLWEEVQAERTPEQQAAAATAEGQAATREAFIVASFQQVLSRNPRSEELKLCQEFLARQETLYVQQAPAVQALPAASPQPAATESAARARESLLRSLFSHTDFLTLR